MIKNFFVLWKKGERSLIMYDLDPLTSYGPRVIES